MLLYQPSVYFFSKYSVTMCSGREKGIDHYVRIWENSVEGLQICRCMNIRYYWHIISWINVVEITEFYTDLKFYFYNPLLWMNK